MPHVLPHRKPLLPAGHVLLVLLVLLPAGPVAAAQGQQMAGDLKVSYLYSFSKYVQWPQGPSPGPRSFDICVIRGDDRLGPHLRRLEKRTVNGRPIVTHMLSGLPDEQICEMVYFAACSRSEIAADLERLAGTPVLTIADIAGFAVQGGMIELTREDDRIRFRINVDKVRGAGLRISSRLLKLATIVREMEY